MTDPNQFKRWSDKTVLHLRMEFLAAGERLGYPSIGVRLGRRIRAGEASWIAFASRARMKEMAPALRNARILVDAIPEAAPTPPDPEDEQRRLMLARMERARAARSAKRAAMKVSE